MRPTTSMRAALALLALSAVAGGCNCNETISEQDRLKVSPASLTLEVGKTAQATAATRKDVTASATWDSADPKVATVGNGSAAGLITAVQEGQTTIRVKYEGQQATLALTVKAASAPTLESVTVAPASATAAKGQQVSFTAQAAYSDGSTRDVTATATWGASPAGVLSAVDGQVGAFRAAAAGQATVTATFEAKSGTAQVTVSDAAATSLVAVADPSQLPVGEKTALRAFAVFSDGTTGEVTASATFESSAAGVLAVDAGSASATAVSPGKVTVTAGFEGLSATVEVTVNDAKPARLAVSPKTAVMARDTSLAFDARKVWGDGTWATVTEAATWTSSSPGVVSVSDDAGTKGVAKALFVGQARVQASLSGASGEARVTVTGAELIELAVTPATVTAPAGQDVPFRATGLYADGTRLDLTRDVAWASSAPAVATVEAAGALAGTAHAVSAGTAIIGAAKDGKTASATLTVSTATLTKVEIVPASATLLVGMGAPLEARGTWSDGTRADLTHAATWKLESGSSVVVGDGAADKGRVVAVAAGASTVSATFGGMSGTAQLTVSASPVASLAVVPASATLSPGASLAFKAEATLEDGAKVDVTGAAAWTTSDASVLLVSNDTADRGTATGVALGTASLQAAAWGKTAQAQVTVSAPEITGIDLVAGHTALPVGASTPLQVFASLSDGSTQEVTSLATVASSAAATVAVDGMQAVAKAPGMATLTATHRGFTDTLEITVTSAALSAVDVVPASLTLPVGVSDRLSAVGTYSDGSQWDVTGACAWASDLPSIATVSDAAGSKGLVTGQAEGEAQVAATLAGVVGHARVKVSSGVSVTAVEVEPATSALGVGGGVQLTATARFSDGSSRDVTAMAAWSSSADAVVSVGADGHAAALAAGTATVTATFATVQGTAQITVTSAALVSLAVEPASASLLVGGKLSLKATGKFSDGSTADLTEQAAWTSDSAAAAVSDAAGTKGVVTGLEVGSSEITAEYGGQKGKATLAVGGTLQSLQVKPATASVAVGRTVAFQALGTDSTGATIDVTKGVIWTTSAPAVASVSNAAGAEGVATGVSVGQAKVTATMGTLHADATLDVSGAVLSRLRLVATRTSLPPGGTTPLRVFAEMSDGTTTDVTAAATLTSSAPATLAVVAGALAQGVAAGQTKVTATYQGLSDALDFTVTAAALQALALEPATLSLAPGQKASLLARATYSDGSSWDVTGACSWTSDATTVATVDQGRVTGLAAGQASVSAALGGKTAAASVTVKAGVTLASIAVSPATSTVAVGASIQSAATATWSDGTTSDLTGQVVWSSSDVSVADFAEAPAGLALALSAGQATLTATSGTVSGTASVTVVAKILQSLALSPATASLPVGGSQRFRAVATFSDSTTADVSAQAAWRGEGVAIAVGDGAAGKGTVTGVAEGLAAVVASYGGQTARASVIVRWPIASLEVLPATAAVALGESAAFTARATDAFGQTFDVTALVTWTAGTPSVASVSNSLGSEGQATGVGVGQSTVVATYGTLTASGTLDVGAKRLRKLVLSPATASLAIGQKVDFTANGTWSDGTSGDVTSEVTAASGWASSSAHVSLSGRTATAVSQGVAEITATLDDLSSGPAVVTVGGVALESIEVTPTSLSLPKGSDRALAATGRYSDGSEVPLTITATWKTSAASVATVGAGVVHGVAPGTAEITASVGTVTSNAVPVTVTDAVIQSIELTPATASVPLKLTTPFKAEATMTDGTKMLVTSSAEWLVADPSVASVSAGVAKGEGQGTTTLRARQDGVTSNPATLTVEPPVVISLVLEPTEATVVKGLTASFKATGTYSDGSTADVTALASWTSLDPLVATVAAGVATGVEVGQTTVRVSMDLAAPVEATVTVKAVAVDSVVVSPDTARIRKGERQRFSAIAYFNDGTSSNVTATATWSSTNTSVATMSGEEAYGAGVGDAGVVASFGGVDSLAAALTVDPAAIVSIALAPLSEAVPVGLTRSFTAEATYTDTTKAFVTASAEWLSLDVAVATVAGGVAKGVSPGTTSIRARQDGVTSDPATLVVGAPVVVSLALDPTAATVVQGLTTSFKAIGAYSDGTTGVDVTALATWTSLDPAVASVAAGVAKGESAGTAGIRVSMDLAAPVEATLTVEAVKVVSVVVTPADATIRKGEQQAFAAVAHYNDGSTTTVTTTATWSSTNPSAATMSGPTAFGAGVGVAGIVASYEGVDSLPANLTVDPAGIVSIALDKSAASVPDGLTTSFTAEATYTDGTKGSVTSTAEWLTGDATIATVAGGVAKGEAPGSTTLRARQDGIASAPATLTVTAAVVISLSVDPTDTTVPRGATRSFKATGAYSDGTSGVDVTALATWTSSDPLVATVSAGVAKGLELGPVTITAAMDLATPVNASLTVVGPAIVSILVEPQTKATDKGRSVDYVATATLTDGTTSVITTTATWSSSDESVATVDNQGTVSTLAVGSTEISASKDGVTSNAAPLTVGPAVIAEIIVSPTSATAPKGVPVTFTATAKYTDGATDDVTATVTWASSQTGVATLDATGQASTVGLGTTAVTATLGAVTSVPASLEVLPPAIKTILVSPASQTVKKGLTKSFTATATMTDDTTEDVTATASWSSLDTSVATVTAGVAKGEGVGTAGIVAQQAGKTSNEVALIVEPAALVSIHVTPESDSVVKGTTRQYAATGTYTDSTTQVITASVTWGSTNGAVASVSASGLATTLAEGDTQISASAGTVVSNFADLHVSAAPAVLVSIEVTPPDPAAVSAGVLVNLTATGSMDDGTHPNLDATATWTSSNPAAATVANGVVTTKAAGDAVIQACVGTICSNPVTVHVNPRALVSIAVTPTNATVPVGLTWTFTATATYTDASTADVTGSATWVSSNTAVATVSAGVALGKTVGTVNVKAAIGMVESNQAILVVDVPALTSVSVTPVNPTVAPEFKLQLSATALYSDGSVVDVTSNASTAWSAASGNVTVSATGLVTGVSGGTVAVQASFGGKAGSTDVTVTNATLVAIGVTPSPLSLPAGVKAQLTATGYFSDSTSVDITSLVTWSQSPATGIVSVSTTGLLTAVAAGSATVSATFGAHTGSTAVTVTGATISSVQVVPANAVVQIGYTLGYAATGSFSDGTTFDLTLSATWSSTTPAVASISDTGATKGVATGLSAGGTTIRATFGTATGSTALTVSSATLVSVSVSPAAVTNPLGLGEQFTATGNFSDGTTMDVTESATWTSSAPAVASVSNAAGTRGYAATLAVGTTTITATAGGMTGSASLKVTSVTLQQLLVTPANPRIGLNGPVQFTATGVYSDGSTQDVTFLATWTSGNTAVADIRNDFGFEGLALGKTAGTSLISASYGGMVGSTTLTVTNFTLLEFYITPIGATVGVGLSAQFTASGVWNDGTTADLTPVVVWSSSSTATAQVSNAPGSQGLATGLSAGATGTATASIGATYGAMTATPATLTVIGSPLTAIAVSPASATLPIGVQSPFKAIGTYANGTTQDLTADVAWSSSAPAVANVSGAAGTAGVATTLAVGSTVITARLGAISGTANLTVSSAALTSVVVAPATAQIPIGFWVPYTAEAVYNDGTRVNVTAQASWTTGNAAVAVADNADGHRGRVTGVAVGSTSVIALFGGLQGTASATVLNVTLTSVTLYYWNGTGWASFPGGGIKAPVVGVGVPLQLKAVGTFSNGMTLDVTEQCAWRVVPRANGTVSNVDGSRGVLILTLAGKDVNVSAGYAGGWFGNDKVYTP